MSEYVFRDAPGFGCDMSELMDGSRETVGDYFAANANYHYGTLHEEIVRCRDCELEINDYCSRPDEWNDDLWFPVEPDGFCAWGRKARTMSELKPCPFCGGEAEMLGDDVICSKCFALMTENTARGESMGYEVSPIEMWNTRAERTCTQIDGCCSVCGLGFETIGYSEHRELPNFCPNCGAKVVSK